MENLDFEIEIDLASGRDYPVTVVHSPAGEGRGTLHFPYDELALENHLTKLQLALLNSGRGQRRVVPAEERTVREFGTSLFDALFAGEVRTLLDVSRHEARSKGTGLRVKLRCRAPELAALPWEFLFDTEVDEYMCLSRQTPLVRYLEVSTPCEPLRVALPLRILGVVASPKDLDSLDVDREKQRVEQAVAHLVERGKVELEWLAKPTWRELQQALSRKRWHVVHFIGHGGFDPRRDEGMLAFEDDDGNAHLLGAGDVGLLLGDHDDLRLAVLNACEGARSSTRDVFSSTAAVLVRKGTPGVVAMQYEITDLAAIELARTFYDCVADGQAVDTAMSEARKAVRLSLPGTLEWGTPVLFMRAPDGVLFDVDGSTATPPAAPPALPTAPTRSERSSRPSTGRRVRMPGRRTVIIAAAVAVALLAAGVSYAVWPDKKPASVAAAGADLLDAHGIALGPDGTVFVGDKGRHRIVAIAPDKRVRVLAGSGAGEILDGPARQAGVNDPESIAVGPDGTVYFVDGEGGPVLRRIVNGKVETVRPKTNADFQLWSKGMVIDAAGRIFLTTPTRVLVLQPSGQLDVLAGSGDQTFTHDSPPVATQLPVNNPIGAALGPDGSLYIADANNYRIRRIDSNDMITTVAGNGQQEFSGHDGDPAVNVGLGYPADVGFDRTGNLYILSSDRSIRRVGRDGNITTVVPSAESGFAGDSQPLPLLRFGDLVEDFAVNGAGDMFVIDNSNHRVRVITHDGKVSTLA